MGDADDYRRREQIIMLLTANEKAAIQRLAADTVDDRNGLSLHPSVWCREILSLAVQAGIHERLKHRSYVTFLHTIGSQSCE